MIDIAIIVADAAFPRLDMIKSLILALQRYPSLARMSTDALVDLGSAIARNTKQPELDALLDGLLVDEAPVRHACLQALTVSAIIAARACADFSDNSHST